MRALVLAFALTACASTSRVERLEKRLDDTYTRAVTTCQRLEEYQTARDGRVVSPCHPQDAHAVAAPAQINGSAR